MSDAEWYREFAGFAAGVSPCFQEWALRAADDRLVMAWISTLPEPKRQPNLVFAAARWHGVPAPGPYSGLREALLGDAGTIRATILRRRTQTNEVGRLTTLVPAFAQLAAGGPVALLEVGASAGLCLYPDRYDYDWRPLGGLTGSVGPVLTCEASGPVPIPGAPLEVGWRGGIDLNPLDVRSADDVAWLATLVWPEQQTRRDRLAAAVAVARRNPPTLVAGDLLEELPGLVERATGHGLVIVFHTSVICYLDVDERRGFADLMGALVADGACHWVSNEEHHVVPGLPLAAGGLHHTLGVDGRAVASADQHGAALRWR